MKQQSILTPISVVITVYNDHQYLQQALESIFEQTLLPSEIIVVDDGSIINVSENLVDKFTNNAQNIEVFFLKKVNGGASSARNYGLSVAKEDYIAFLDVDDKMLSNNLYDKYQCIKNLDEGFFGVYGGAITSEGIKQEFSVNEGSIDTSLIDVELVGIPGGVPFYLFKRNLLVAIGGFDENIKSNEDFDLLIRLIKENKKSWGINSIGYYRNIRKNSLSRPKNPMNSFNSVMFFLDKAEEHEYYSKEYLKRRRMSIHISLAKRLFLRGQFIKAFCYARKGFKFSSPFTAKQKILYFLSLSFI